MKDGEAWIWVCEGCGQFYSERTKPRHDVCRMIVEQRQAGVS